MATAQQDKAGTQQRGGMMDAAKDVAGKVGDAAHDAMHSAGQMASDAASYIGRKAETATSAVGSGLKSAVGAFESGGKYFTEHSMSDIAGDVTNIIRRNPIPSLLVAVGLGFLMARALRA